MAYTWDENAIQDLDDPLVLEALKMRGAALALVQGQPGITIPKLAAKMGVEQNYFYRVLPDLEQEGKVTKKGRGWYPGTATHHGEGSGDGHL